MIGLFLEWYFLDIPAKIKKIWVNYVWFFARYFALGPLARDFLAPWKGLTFKREKRGFDIGDAFSTAAGNLMSRLIGALVRLFFIAAGLVVELAVFLAGAAAFAGWMVFIPLAVYAFFRGLSLLV